MLLMVLMIILEDIRVHPHYQLMVSRIILRPHTVTTPISTWMAISTGRIVSPTQVVERQSHLTLTATSFVMTLINSSITGQFL